MTELFFDTETRCRVPISYGTDVYTRAAECILATYALDDEPVQCWEPLDEWKIPNKLDDALRDDRIIKVAASATFDRAITLHALKIPTAVTAWSCTKAQAYSAGLPGSLALQGMVLGIGADHQKLDSGKNLIQVFCVPKSDGTYWQPWDKPEDWAEFKRYGIRDTDSLREIRRKLPSHNYRGENLAGWHLDQLINGRGFGFDDDFARHAVDFLKTSKALTDQRMADNSAGAVTSATQRARLLTFLQKKHNLDIPNLTAAEVRSYLERDDLHPEVRLLLETRLEAGKNSGAKYGKGLRMMGPGKRIRHAIQFNGAGRTGRSSGKGFQPHSMALPKLTIQEDDLTIKQVMIKASYIDNVVMPGIRNRTALDYKFIYGGPNEAAALCLRHVITAAPDNELVVADYSNIESRILAWIAEEPEALLAYRSGIDLYRVLAGKMFGIDPKDVTQIQRQGAKAALLAFGYGGGVGALVTMAAGLQFDLNPLADLILPNASPAQLKKAEKAWRRAFLKGEDYELEPAVYKACDVLKQSYRESNDHINTLRHDLDVATRTAIKEPGRSFVVGKCKIWSTGTWLIIELPNGDRLLYANPRVECEIDVDPDTGKEQAREYITFATARGMQWRRERAWSGLFLENVVQGIANRVLRAGLLRAHRECIKIPAVASFLATLPPEERTPLSLHVHDEIVLDVPKGSVELKQLEGWITHLEPWMAGLPLVAEGWVNERFGKR